MGDYRVILADPPWSYKDRNSNGKRGAAHKYDVLTVEQIRRITVAGRTVPDLCAGDATLFLWSTKPLIPEALRVMSAWGFTYKGAGFDWVKTTATGKYHYGLGHWTRGNMEYCLQGVRGKPRRVGKDVPSLIVSPRREHSRKPDEVRDRIVRLIGDVPRIELFATQLAPGWDAWGKALGNGLRIDHAANREKGADTTQGGEVR